MSAKTSIAWTDSTWSPLWVRVKADAAAIAEAKGYTSLIQIATKMAGRPGQHCEHVSDGCKVCYSGTWQARCLKVNGTGLPFDRRARDLVDPFVNEKILPQPLEWRKAKKIFVENQSDLFAEWVSDEDLDRVFAVMALCPQHTFQILTKRPERMLAYLGTKSTGDDRDLGTNEMELVERWGVAAGNMLDGPWIWGDGKRFRSRIEHFISASLGLDDDGDMLAEDEIDFPLPNVHLGVSVENQATADVRIPLLLKTPAAIHFVSYEPALGPVDFCELPSASGIGRYLDALSNSGVDPGAIIPSKLDQIIFGGESGPGARPCDMAWARSTRDQCKAAGVAFFMKQVGAVPVIPGHRQAHYDWGPGIGLPESDKRFTAVEPHRESSGKWRIHLKDRKGGDMEEWPKDLRVREFPW